MKHKKERKIKFKAQNSNKKVNYQWIITITIVTFLIAVLLGYFSLVFMNILSFAGASAILFVLVFIGIFFDLLGIAVTAASETPFHSMAASRVKGAKETIGIIRNASSVANFFNDVIGDISGIVSGSATSAILAKMAFSSDGREKIASIVLSGVVAAITVGGKAIGKEIALRYSNQIVYRIGVLISYFHWPKSKKK